MPPHLKRKIPEQRGKSTHRYRSIWEVGIHGRRYQKENELRRRIYGR